MDKSGRATLTENIRAMVSGAKSRLSWATSYKLDGKAIERLEKDAHGEKGVGIGFVDEVAWRLGVKTWQLFVPGFDPKNPPRLTTEPPEVTLEMALAKLGSALARDMPDEVRQDVADLLSKLAHRRGLARHQEELMRFLQSSPSPTSVAPALPPPQLTPEEIKGAKALTRAAKAAAAFEPKPAKHVAEKP